MYDVNLYTLQDLYYICEYNLNNILFKLTNEQIYSLFQKEECKTFYEYQEHVLLINNLLYFLSNNPKKNKLKNIINILNMKQAQILKQVSLLQKLKHLSSDDNSWYLYLSLIQLPTIKLDFFGKSLAIIKEHLDSIKKVEFVIIGLRKLLPLLKPPEIYLYNQNDKKINDIIDIMDNISEILFYINESKFKDLFSSYLSSIYKHYDYYINYYKSLSSKDKNLKDTLILPKAQFFGAGIGYFTLHQSIALELLCINDKGERDRKNLLGTHAVCQKNNIFYKPNPKGRFFIGPEKEYAIYSAYQLINCSEAIAPTILGKIQNVIIKDSNYTYERTLQAGYGIDGILLQDLLKIMDSIPKLERCFGKNEGKNIFFELLDNNWYTSYLNDNKHLQLSKLNKLSIEDAGNIIINEFEKILSPISSDKRFLEFIHIPCDNATKRDIYLNIANHSPEGLIGCLALINKYSSLCIEINSNGILKQISFVEITDLYSTIKHIKKLFKNLSKTKIYKEILSLSDKFDNYNYSAHVLMTLITNPRDHKTDNFIVTVNQDDITHKINSLSIVGIDNDLALETNEDEIHSIIYFLKPMANKIHPQIRKEILSKSPEEFIVTWITLMEDQNNLYNKLFKQELFKQSDIIEDGESCLRIPFTVQSSLIPYIYNKFQQIQDYLQKYPSCTHNDLFEYIHPILAQGHKESLKENNNYERAYLLLCNYLPNNYQNINIQVEKLSKAANKFLQSIDYSKFNIDEKVNIVGKILRTFPDYSILPFDINFNDPETKQIFFSAINYGYSELVAKIIILEQHYVCTTSVFDINTTSILLTMRDRTGKTPFLLACENLDLELLKLLLGPFKNNICFSDYDNNKDNYLSLIINQFINNSNKVASVIRLLGSYNIIQWNILYSSKNWTLLHHLVHVSEYSIEDAESLITYVVKNGASPDIVDNNGITAFDYAIHLNNSRIIAIFIELFAGNTLNINKTVEYFKNNPKEYKSYEQLQNNSLLLRWKLTLDEFKKYTGESSITIQNKKLGKFSLSKDLISKILDKTGNIKEDVSFGRRRVLKLQLTNDYIIYIKQYPELPGIEYAVGKLFELLIGHGTSQTELCRIDYSSQLSYPILLSQGIKGPNLHSILSNPKTSSTFEDSLDKLSFSEIFLTSILVNFEDAKPDNFIVETLSNGKVRLIAIDNDHSFVPPIRKKKTEELLIKSILYCFDIMKESIHPRARELFLCFNPELILQVWLEHVVIQYENYNNLFTTNEQKHLKKRNPSTSLGIPFPKGSIADIYQKFRRLQSLLRNSPTITLIEILRIVIPSIGILYENSYYKYSTPYERFMALSSSQYKVELEGHLTTVVTADQIFQMIDISKDTQLDPQFALEELNTIKQEINSTAQRRLEIHNQVQQGNLIEFNNLFLDTEKERILNGIPNELLPIDYKEFTDKSGNVSIKLQRRVFTTFLSGNYRILNINGCIILNKKLLQKILQKSSQLISLELHNCSNITQDLINTIYFLQYLNSLTLHSITLSEEFFIPNNNLVKLKIIQCKRLSKLVFCNKIQQLYLDDCNTLKQVIVTKCIYEKHHIRSDIFKQDKPIQDYTLQKLYIKDCPFYNPWYNTFENYITSSKSSLAINLANIPLYISTRNLDKLIISIYDHNSKTASLMLRSLANFINLTIPKCLDILSSISTILLERLLRIFKKAYKIKLPCTKHLDLSVFNSKLSDENILQFLQICTSLTDINLSNTNITDELLNILPLHCENIKILNISGCKRISNSISNILENCSFLSYLDISNCEFDNNIFSSLNDNTILKTLILSNTNIIDKNILQLYKLKSLRKLDINSCKNITNIGIKYLSKYNKLRDINISFIKNIMDDSLLLLKAKYIWNLNLSKLHMITDNSISKIALNSKYLSSISLFLCSNITDNTLLVLAENCKRLSFLDLTKCSKITDRGLTTILESCSNLTSLNLKYCEEIKTSFFNLPKHSNLTYLNLFFCMNITDEAINFITNRCLNLKHLDLSYCDKLSNGSLKNLSNCTQLSSVYLTFCSKITSGLLQLSYLQQIQYLDLSYCNITRGVIKQISKACTNLRTLILAKVSLLNSYMTYIRNLPKLKVLDISYTSIDDEGILFLSLGCVNLSLINIIKVDHISFKGIQILQNSHPLLKIQYYT